MSIIIQLNKHWSGVLRGLCQSKSKHQQKLDIPDVVVPVTTQWLNWLTFIDGFLIDVKCINSLEKYFTTHLGKDFAVHLLATKKIQFTNYHQRKYIQFDYSPPEKHLQFTYPLPEKTFLVHLLTTKEHLQYILLPLEKTFSSSPTHHQRKHVAVRQHQRKILQFTYSPPEKTFCSSPTRHQRKHFQDHLFATRENIFKFTYSPPEQTFCSSPTRHQSKHFAVHLLATR